MDRRRRSVFSAPTSRHVMGDWPSRSVGFTRSGHDDRRGNGEGGVKGRLTMYLVAFALLGLAGLLAANRAEIAPLSTGEAPASKIGIDEWACPSGTVGRVSCSFVSVPEDYSDPEINSIRLFMARILPPLETTGEPLLFVGEDLGGVNVDNLGEWQQVSRVTGREIILVDLRGSGRSEPLLSCPELRAVPWLESDLTDSSLAQVRADFNTALTECKERLARGIPLEAYSLQATLRDLDIVRTRLGVDRWTIIGAGEATLVARAYEQQLPDSVQSLVLLGATPTSSDRDIAQYGYANEVLDVVLTDELAASLEQGLQPLEERSIVFTINTSGRTRRVAVSAEVVKPILARAAGDSELLELIPNLISERLAGQQWRSFAVLRAQQYRSDSTALAAALNTLCGDPSVVGAEPIWLSIDDFDSTWTGLVDDRTLDPQLCATWSPARHNGIRRAPTAQTLVINGEYDITAPASAAARIATDWASSNTVVIARSGRPNPFEACVTAAVDEFLRDPSRTLEGICS